MNKPLVLAAAIVALVLAFVIYRSLAEEAAPAAPAAPAPSAATEIPEGAEVVRLTEDGFVPAELTIKAGATVAFVTENGKLFWPASNLHPSHSLYPEFDPLLPVQPDEAWSFTFAKPGEWKYHDHLAPYYTGVITVIE